MSLGDFGISIGKDETQTDVNGIVFYSCVIDANPTSSLRYCNPEGDNAWNSGHVNASVKAPADGVFLKFASKWNTRAAGAAAQQGIAINGVKQAASEIAVGGGDTNYYEKTEAELSSISFSKGDLISIYRDGGGTSTDRGTFALIVKYGTIIQDTPYQFITESQPMTVSTTFERGQYVGVNTVHADFQRFATIKGLDGFQKRMYVHFHQAPTSTDSMQITRRIGASISMTGTSNQTYDNTNFDGQILEISSEQDIPFNKDDNLNIGFVRVGLAGQVIIVSFIVVWEMTLP
jgi:hypothetical protein